MLHLVYESAPANNGNVQSQRIYVAGVLDVTQTYWYDDINRLSTAEEKAGTTAVWKQVYDYDRYGNRNFAAGTTYPDYSQSLTDPVRNPVIDTANNRIKTSAPGQSDYLYDAVGNLTRMLASNRPYHDLAYDAESRQVKADGGATAGGADYGYDGHGRRVKKVVGLVTTVFVYDVTGRTVAEYSNRTQNRGTSYVTQDPLGSTRVVTGQNPGDVRGQYDYHPYGEEISIGRSAYRVGSDIRQKFTGHERDFETSLDYAKARYYSSPTGRFVSPDPLLSSGEVVDPQTWNRFAYVSNNPLRYSDPTGLYRYSARLGGDHKDDYIRSHASEFGGANSAANIIAQRNVIRAAIKRAREALNDKSLSAEEKSKIQNSLNSLGEEYKGNVTIVVGYAGSAAAGQAIGYKDGSITVVLSEDIWTPGLPGMLDTLAGNITHESSHVRDLQDYFAARRRLGEARANRGPTNITRYETERRGWTIESYVYQGLGLGAQPGLQPELNIWDPNWSPSEREAARARGVDNIVGAYVQDGAPLTRDNPGKKISERLRER